MPNPFAPKTTINGMTGFFVDAGPDDHGALFDFDLGVLPAGETRTIYLPGA